MKHNALFSAFLLCLLIATATRAQEERTDEEVVRVNTDLVVLNLTATDAKGDYVRGLRKEDFRVYEDGREQQVAEFSYEETPFAVAILIDTSGSMEGREALARSAAIRFLDGLRGDDVAAVYRFDSEVEQIQDFSPSRDLAPMIYSLRARGMTVLNDAIIRAARDLAQRPEKDAPSSSSPTALTRTVVLQQKRPSTQRSPRRQPSTQSIWRRSIVLRPKDKPPLAPCATSPIGLAGATSRRLAVKHCATLSPASSKN